MAVKEAVFNEDNSRNKPSLYATPLAWMVADFIDSLIGGEGECSPNQTGIVVASDECSQMTMRELARTASHGAVSPLRFSGASPSMLVGLPALQLGVRGPTLCLTMPPQNASGAIVAIINSWLASGEITTAIAVAQYRLGANRHLLKGLVARSAGDDLSDYVMQLCDSIAAHA